MKKGDEDYPPISIIQLGVVPLQWSVLKLLKNPTEIFQQH